ncbi:hypothetical protein CFC21_086797 [Triticum aestivum]|uniref:F-box domain-containing protein n=3 Tax=Triticum TaxID=4564 RepID=A0A9R0YG95_TRITD|nr:uncharacterized protein LOC123133586 [Triticum aestivum]KAF7082971.1 hypothetical protein CFC21_086797 [Triticum aestivum]VAI54269.1 unnamed protein product [Triticum turgidum subsp. durum]
MESEPAVLPDDALAEVLRRLPPHILAEARRVCKAWRDAVDDRLRGSLLPRSVRGIFINFTGNWFSEFFSRPSTGPAIDGGLDFLPCMGVRVKDHCEGLLLCRESSFRALPCPQEYVVNPATRRWARLPKRPPPLMQGFDHTAHLAFEPAVSLHYQVFVIPRVPWRLPSDGESDDDNDNPLLELEWPPASYHIHVYSSVTQRWDETTFFREGEAAGIVADMQLDCWYDPSLYHAVYWQSALYIHCQHGYLTRMSLSDHSYRVIKLPGVGGLIVYSNHRLGRSSQGVYCAILDGSILDGSKRLQVWYLSESCGRIQWVLKHDTRLKTVYGQELGRQWILQQVNLRKEDPEHKVPVDEKYDYDWNSDQDNVLDTEDIIEEAEDVIEDGQHISYGFLGFHPYKEVVFLNTSTTGLAYDWINSKFQDLGSSWTWEEYGTPYGKTCISFPYTPCWISKFPGNELESLLLDEKLYRNKLELEAQLEEESNFTYMGEYELRKQSGRAKRIKDSAAKIRHRHHIAARQEHIITDMKSKVNLTRATKFSLGKATTELVTAIVGS